MPVKRRHGKRRIDQQAEMLAWSGLFRCGYDFFDELDGWGDWTPNDSDTSKRAAAPEAWKRLGAAFMDWWNAGIRIGLPHATGDNGLPWALGEYGEPTDAS